MIIANWELFVKEITAARITNRSPLIIEASVRTGIFEGRLVHMRLMCSCVLLMDRCQAGVAGGGRREGTGKPGRSRRETLTECSAAENRRDRVFRHPSRAWGWGALPKNAAGD